MGQKRTRRTNDALKQPLSPLAYALMSLVSFIVGTVLLLLFIFKAEELSMQGIDEKVFYILLLPMGLSAAAFLFGAMRSYAVYKGKISGGILELGGPIVLFFLVIILGFKLVPDTSAFDFTIFLRDADGKSVLESEGAIKIILGNEIKTGKIDKDGSVDFKMIPAKFRNAGVPLELVEAAGWQFTNRKTSINCLLKGNNAVVTIERDENTFCCVSGFVIDGEGNFIPGAKVIIKDIETHTNENGWFFIRIPPGKQEKKQVLMVQKEGYETRSYPVLPEDRTEIQILLNRK